jgi:SAM-dependent methyltransferase
MLELGCGGGHFARVCKHFGHTVVASDIEFPAYYGIAAALGVTRTINELHPLKDMVEVEGKFDLIAATATEFNVFTDHSTDGSPKRYWTLEEWKYLIVYMLRNNLRSPGRIYFELNYEQNATGRHFNAALMEFFAAHGAQVNFERGRIDWRMQPAEALAKIAPKAMVTSTPRRTRQAVALGD